MQFQKPPIGSVIDRGNPLALGLIQCWLLNERASKTTFDIVHGYKGDVRRAGSTNNDKGLVGDGTAPFGIYIPSNLPITDPCTICVLVSGLVSGVGQDLYQTRQHSLYLTNTNTLRYYLATNSAYGNAFSNSLAGKTVTSIVATCTGLGGTLRMYINGVDDTASSYGGNGAISANTYSAIGCSANNDYGGMINGAITAAYLYNRALTAGEVKSLHENPYQMIVGDTPPKFYPASRLIDPTRNIFTWR